MPCWLIFGVGWYLGWGVWLIVLSERDATPVRIAPARWVRR